MTRPSRRRQPPSSRRSSPLKRVLVAGAILAGTGLAGLATGVGFMVWQIPPIDQLLAARPTGVTTIFDRKGRVVASVQNGENREIVSLEEIAPCAQQAVIAAEDIRFHDHIGLDPRGLARALFTRGERGGGSTLTQQLAKNLFLTADRTITRKVADMWLALQLERTLTKRQILEMYLNQVYFGHGAFGIESAAHKYFGKKAKDLEIAEAAQLASLLPAPEYRSPYRNPEVAETWRKVVLQRMVDAGYLTAEQADAAASRKPRFANTPDYAYRAPYFTSQVLSQLTEKLGRDLVERGALRIHTTMDLDLQETAERLIREGVARNGKRHRFGQGALVAVEPGTGAVLALVGGTSYDASQFNRAVQAHRQPGSTFKPFVYLAAFIKGYTPGSTVEDGPANFDGYRPQNYDHRFHGTVTYEKALAFSYNIPAVRVAYQVGIDEVLQTAQLAGLPAMRPELSVALGSAEVTPLALAGAYATIGAGGVYAEPHLVARVEDQAGQLVETTRTSGAQVFPPDAVAALHRCLAGVITYGTAAGRGIGRPAGGKTGTTSENRDTWFAGYTPDLACVVWFGNDDNTRLAGNSTGGLLAAPIWQAFMGRAHRGLPVRGLAMAASEDATASASASPDMAGSLPLAPSFATPTPVPVGEGEPTTPVLQGSPLAEPLPTLEPTLTPAPPAPVPTDEATGQPGGGEPQFVEPTP